MYVCMYIGVNPIYIYMYIYMYMYEQVISRSIERDGSTSSRFRLGAGLVFSNMCSSCGQCRGSTHRRRDVEGKERLDRNAIGTPRHGHEHQHGQRQQRRGVRSRHLGERRRRRALERVEMPTCVMQRESWEARHQAGVQARARAGCE